MRFKREEALTFIKYLTMRKKSLVKRCEDVLKSGQTECAINMLLDSGIQGVERDVLLLQANRMSRLQNSRINGTIDNQYIDIQLNEITKNVIQILGKMKKSN